MFGLAAQEVFKSAAKKRGVAADIYFSGFTVVPHAAAFVGTVADGGVFTAKGNAYAICKDQASGQFCESFFNPPTFLFGKEGGFLHGYHLLLRDGLHR